MTCPFTFLKDERDKGEGKTSEEGERGLRGGRRCTREAVEEREVLQNYPPLPLREGVRGELTRWKASLFRHLWGDKTAVMSLIRRKKADRHSCIGGCVCVKRPACHKGVGRLAVVVVVVVK